MQHPSRLSRFVGKLPLRAIFIVPFMIQILIVVGVTGYLSFRNGERAINTLANELQTEISHQIEDRLHQYLLTPHLVNKIQAADIESGRLDLSDNEALFTYYWQNLNHFPELNAAFLGTEEGMMVGARRPTDREIEVMLADDSTGQSLNYYVAGQGGLPDAFVEGAADYDPRQRSWYLQALEIGHSYWSPIYLDFSTGMLVITAGQPVYTADGEPLGVVGSAFQFEQVNDFLRGLEIGQHGQTFIIDRAGMLVSTSSEAPISKVAEEGLIRLSAAESDDIVQRETALYLEKTFGNLKNIEGAEELTVTIDGEMYYVHVSPITDGYGLDWLVAVIVPAADFMAEIEANNQLTIGMIGLALVVTMILGVLTTQWITRPLLQLRDSADAFSQGQWEERVTIEREDELGQLGAAFNHMAGQLQDSFTALRQSQTRYESMFNYVPIMLWEEDFSAVKQYLDELLAQGITDLDAYFEAHPEAVAHCARLVKILAVNQTTLDILQTDQETALSEFDRFFGEAGYDVFRRELIALTRGETYFAAESNSRTADGRELQIFVRLVIAPGHEETWSRILVSIEDITQRIMMEKALRQSEQRLKQAQRMAKMGDWEFDIESGAISWSEEIHRLFERPLHLGPPDFEENMAYYLPEDRAKLIQQVKMAIESKREFSDTYKLKLPSGKVAYHLGTIFPVSDEHGRVIKLTGTAQDITERVLLEKQIQDQERLAAVGQLAAGIAHDFNNILSGITLYTDLLLRSPEEMSAQSQKRLATISRQAERAAQLIQQILDFSRRSALVRKPMNLLQPLQELAEMLERILPENIALEFTAERPVYIADIDPGRIQQVFMNLAVNARDAMADGGRLSISVSDYLLTAEAKPPVAEMEAGNWIKIVVADSGSGIPDEALPHIFEPFFTTKPPDKGTGLGLAQVYGIVTQHDGFIQIDRQAVEGTAVVIYLPQQPQPEEANQGQKQDEAKQGQGETILVVEDNDVTREALVATLETLNYKTRTARNGREALEILQQQGTTVGIVLTDMLMPETSGLELAAEMRRQHFQTPIVILSGYLLEDDLETMRQLNVTGWLNKPPNLKKLATLLHKGLHQKQEQIKTI